MKWASFSLNDQILSWLEGAFADRYARDKHLDPFATSMRDFDDVSPDLRAIRDGKSLGKTDAKQRISDLKGASLVGDNGKALTNFGKAVLGAWEHYGVASKAKADEFARLLLLALEARNLGVPMYEGFRSYWIELRSHFSPIELIDNWDALYAINYLDYERGGFTPGALLRAEKLPVSEIKLGLSDFAQNHGGSSKAIKGAKRIERAASGKIPRGRHRATFCGALEIVAGGEKAMETILANFGYPKKPNVWLAFNNSDKAKIRMIAKDYDLLGHKTTEVAKPPKVEAAPPKKISALDLDLVDFSKVLVQAPKPSQKISGSASKKAGTQKNNYVEQAQANDETGKAGEDFALRYEQWRLRNHPELFKKIKHVSKGDDTLGYDIISSELDGMPRYVEVKGTFGPLKSRFFMSDNELRVARKCKEKYVVLRVSLNEKKPTCCEIPFPFDEVLDFEPASYIVTFKSETTE